jgi:hypothetical protein
MIRSWRSSKLWATSLVLTLCVASTATAQELPNVEEPCTPNVVDNRRAVLTHEGESGIWFHLEVARCLLGRLSALPEYARHVRLLEDRLSLGDERDALRARQVALAEQEAQAASEALEAAVRRAREAEEARDAWYRRPGLWLAMGVVLSVALQAVAVWAYSEVSE